MVSLPSPLFLRPRQYTTWALWLPTQGPCLPLPRRLGGFRTSTQLNNDPRPPATSFQVTSARGGHGPPPALPWSPAIPRGPEGRLLCARLDVRHPPSEQAWAGGTLPPSYAHSCILHAPVFIEHILGAGTVLGSGGVRGKEDKQKATGRQEAVGWTWAQRWQSSWGSEHADPEVGCPVRGPRALC